MDVIGEVLINMTVALGAGSYGLEGSKGSSILGSNMAWKETGVVSVSIYHKGVASSWTITPVWSNQK